MKKLFFYSLSLTFLITSLWGQQKTNDPKEKLMFILSLSHGMEGDLSDQEKHLIEEIKSDITPYLPYLEEHINIELNRAGTIELNRAQNAIHLLANAEGNIGAQLLISKYGQLTTSVNQLEGRLRSYQSEDRSDSTAFLLRRQANVGVVLRRAIITSCNTNNDPVLQGEVLSDFREMDYSTQLTALKYLAVQSDDSTVEQRKYDQLREIYQDRTQLLFNSEILKSFLDKQ